MSFHIAKNPFIIVNYHYIRDVESSDLPGLNVCSVKKFREHLEFLTQSYKIVTLPKIYKEARRNVKHNANYCALTFDDGLIDHYQNALPLLKKYSATGTFFPITMTLGKKVPAAHKLRILLSLRSVRELADILEKFIRNEYSQLTEKYHIPREKRLRPNTRKFDDPFTANFKDTMIALPKDVSSRFLEECFGIFSLDEDRISKSLFLNAEKLRKLKAEGMVIGGHTHRHPALDRLNYLEQKEEISASKTILERLLRSTIDIFSYPHGRFNDCTFKILKEENFNLALTIESRQVRKRDNRLALPRYDANDLTI